MTFSVQKTYREFCSYPWQVKLAVAGGFGLAPFAPGTWATIPGLCVGILIHQLSSFLSGESLSSFVFYVSCCLITLTWIGTSCIAYTEKAWNVHDDPRTAMDEIVGAAFAMAWFTPSWLAFALCFAFFRLFDIWKPGPIGHVDREWHSAFGTVFDDILAGIVAAVLTVLSMKIYGLLS